MRNFCTKTSVQVKILLKLSLCETNFLNKNKLTLVQLSQSCVDCHQEEYFIVLSTAFVLTLKMELIIHLVLIAFLFGYSHSEDLIIKPPTPDSCTKPHERWVECGESCNRDFCRVPNYFVACVSQCAPGCYCECGYYRDFEDNCVPRLNCPSFDNTGYVKWCPKPVVHNCPKNEVFNDCASFCGGTCKDFRLPRRILCIQGCKIGCVCKDGFARHPISDKCVPVEKCPTTDEFDYEKNIFKRKFEFFTILVAWLLLTILSTGKLGKHIKDCGKLITVIEKIYYIDNDSSSSSECEESEEKCDI